MPRRVSKPFSIGVSVVIIGLTSATVFVDVRMFLVLSLIDICALMILLDRRQAMSSRARLARFQADQTGLFESIQHQLDDMSVGTQSGVSESRLKELLDVPSPEQNNNERRLKKLDQLAQKQLTVLEGVVAYVRRPEENPVQAKTLLDTLSSEQGKNEQRLRQLGQLAQKQLTAIERVEAHVREPEVNPVQARALAQWRHQTSEDLAWLRTHFGNDFHENNVEVANNGADE